MATNDIASFGGLGGDDPVQRSVEDTTWGGIGDSEGEDKDQMLSPEEAHQKRMNEIEDRMNDTAASVYGQNAAQRWQGTPAVGLSIFQHRTDRTPDFDRQGNIRAYRTAPGAPMATPPEGLIGGRVMENMQRAVDVSNPFNASLTPRKDWQAMFTPKSGPSAAPFTAQSRTPGAAWHPLNKGGYVY